jgi:ABC-type sugar transport system substrate-binding protein
MAKKSLGLAALALVLLLIFIGRSIWLERGTKPEVRASYNTEATPSANRKIIGFSVAGFSTPYFRILIDYAKLEAIKQGIELKVVDAEWDMAKQQKQIDDLISQKVDALCVIPIDSKQIIPALRRVKKQGIPLIDVNVQNDPQADEIIDTFVGASMEEEATYAAESIMKLLGDKGGNVIILEGAAGNFAAIHRTMGFEEAVKKNPNIHIIDRKYTGWDMGVAEKAMEGFLTKYKKIDALYAHDDNIAIGAIKAIKKAGRAGEFPIASITGNIEGYEAVKRGEIYSTVSQPPDWEGTTAIRVAVKLINGEKVDKWVKTPVKQVTKENVSNFKGIW